MGLYAMRKVGNCFVSVLDVLIGICTRCLVVVAVAQWVEEENAQSGCESDETT